MAGLASKGIRLKGEWRAALAQTARRFDAWWEGYPFDPVDGDSEAGSAQAPSGGAFSAGLAADQLSIAIWGEGRTDPGDAAWTMRHARTLGAPLRARVAVLGAGAGGPLEDLRTGARWKTYGYARHAPQRRGLNIQSYSAAMTRLPRPEAEAGLCFFDLHREADPGAIARFAASLVKLNAPVAFIDFTVARKGVRLRPCFVEPWSGAPRCTDQVAEGLEAAGFRIVDIVDETRAFTPLVVRGWARWKRLYDTIAAIPSAPIRIEQARLFASCAAIWAERLEAMRAGHLQVTRALVRRAR